MDNEFIKYIDDNQMVQVSFDDDIEPPIDDIPIIKLTSSCPICLCAIENKYETECGHIFCDACIKQWICVHNNCPVCRHNFTSSESDDPDGFKDEDDQDNNDQDDKIKIPPIDDLFIYATNYNVLRIMAGMSGLSYSN